MEQVKFPTSSLLCRFNHQFAVWAGLNTEAVGTIIDDYRLFNAIATVYPFLPIKVFSSGKQSKNIIKMQNI